MFLLILLINLRCKNIAYLSLCYCYKIEEDGIDLIGIIENLISVDLSGCNCGDHVNILFLWLMDDRLKCIIIWKNKKTNKLIEYIRQYFLLLSRFYSNNLKVILFNVKLKQNYKVIKFKKITFRLFE